MKHIKFMIAYAISILFLAGCAKSVGTIASLSTPVPVAVSAADLLADALKYYEAGNYEEAIIAYMGVIEIEPKNFEAQFGLGRAYRRVGQNEDAVTQLLAARGRDRENREVSYELGYAYMATGQYAEAETLAAPMWDDDPEDVDAGILLLMSLAGQEKTEEMQVLLENETLYEAVKATTDESSMYLGPMDENGRRSGKGVGLYEGGYVYVGEYADGVRSGQGIWYYPGNRAYYIGAWAEDMPNGYGECHYPENRWMRMGQFVNGLEHGEMIGKHMEEGGSYYVYRVENGVPTIIGEKTHDDGVTYVLAYDPNGSSDNLGSLVTEDTSLLMGVSPFDRR